MDKQITVRTILWFFGVILLSLAVFGITYNIAMFFGSGTEIAYAVAGSLNMVTWYEAWTIPRKYTAKKKTPDITPVS